MKYSRNEGGYVLRCYAGEDIVREVTDFCVREAVTGGWIWGLGAVESAVLGYFDMESKSYLSVDIDAHLEIVSLTGNISMMDEKPVLHLHACLSDEEFGVVGGHVFSAVVSATAEILILPFGSGLKRKADPFTGLNLFDMDT